MNKNPYGVLMVTWLYKTVKVTKWSMVHAKISGRRLWPSPRNYRFLQMGIVHTRRIHYAL